jgi:hypothetical protein
MKCKTEDCQHKAKEPRHIPEAYRGCGLCGACFRKRQDEDFAKWWNDFIGVSESLENRI